MHNNFFQKYSILRLNCIFSMKNELIDLEWMMVYTILDIWEYYCTYELVERRYYYIICICQGKSAHNGTADSFECIKGHILYKVSLLHQNVVKGGMNGAQKWLNPAETFESFCINIKRFPYSETITMDVVAVIHGHPNCTWYTDSHFRNPVSACKLYIALDTIYTSIRTLCSRT